jgi:methionyl-tRNA synthetase
VAVLLNPVMPASSGRVWSCLGAEPALGPLAEQRVQDAAEWGRLPAGTRVTRSGALFPRLPEAP